MLVRQRCILYMLEQANRPVNHLELTKWAFLLAREMPTAGGPSFYDFLPYHYGPFSFTLFREVDGLVGDGYLREGNMSKTWERVEDVASNAQDLSSALLNDAASVVDRFVSSSSDDLTSYVYSEFPWYTVNSKTRRLAKRPAGKIAIHTVGYEKWSVDRLLDELMRRGIERIIDVRSNPIARRYGFHKNTLRRLASKVDIQYTHFPELGIPSRHRRELLSRADYRELLARYDRGILRSSRSAVKRVAELIGDKPSVLLCMEADPAFCHRTCLAKSVLRMTGLPIHDLRGTQCDLALS